MGALPWIWSGLLSARGGGTDDYRMLQPSHESRPSADYLAIIATPLRQLNAMMKVGHRPDLEALCGWEWRGTNLPATSRLLGIRRFIKGFRSINGTVHGYNVSVTGTDLDLPWIARLQRDGRREWAPFAVTLPDRTADGPYRDALLLDYGAVENPEPGLPRRLRDYLVAVPPGSDEILLGQAFVVLGRLRVPVGWFVLERLGRIPAP